MLLSSRCLPEEGGRDNGLRPRVPWGECTPSQPTPQGELPEPGHPSTGEGGRRMLLWGLPVIFTPLLMKGGRSGE